MLLQSADGMKGWLGCHMIACLIPCRVRYSLLWHREPSRGSKVNHWVYAVCQPLTWEGSRRLVWQTEFKGRELNQVLEVTGTLVVPSTLLLNVCSNDACTS